MSYNTPTIKDRAKLLDFYSRLREHFEYEGNQGLAVSVLRQSFKWYLFPADHTEFERPYPPIPRREFNSLSIEERKSRLKDIAQSRIQEKMEMASYLAHVHGITLENIDGLQQSPKQIRKQIQESRPSNQAKIAEY